MLAVVGDACQLAVSDCARLVCSCSGTDASSLLPAMYCLSTKHVVTLQDTAGNVVFANDNQTLFYVTKDKLDRPFKVSLHALSLQQVASWRKRPSVFTSQTPFVCCASLLASTAAPCIAVFFTMLYNTTFQVANARINVHLTATSLSAVIFSRSGFNQECQRADLLS